MEKIKAFLAINKGSGYGNGDGNGDGNGYGDGYGDGDGSGYGDEYGDGSGLGYDSGSGDNLGYGYGNGSGDSSSGGYSSGDGYGYGDGCGGGLKSINGQDIYIIDRMPTILYNIHGNYAKGGIVNVDFIITPCYIAKVGNSFAHGETLREAFKGARAKELRNMSMEERIAKVVEQYPLVDAPIPHKELFRLHNLLTGSCRMGRNEFAKAHNLDPEHGSMTMRVFITLTADAYGGEIIKQLAKAYGLSDV